MLLILVRETKNVIVSHKYKFIFVHIPKNAGVSLENVLVPMTGELDYVTDSRRHSQLVSEREKNSEYNVVNAQLRNSKEQDGGYWQHGTILDICSAVGEELNKYLKFAFVRNPWDRSVSYYRFLCQLDLYGPVDPSKAPSFREWILSDETSLNPHGPVWWQLRFKKKSQLEWLCDEKGELMVDFIGKYENLQRDFETVMQKLNLPCVKLPHMNSLKPEDYRSYYDSETREKVGEWFKRDVELFNYSFWDRR